MNQSNDLCIHTIRRPASPTAPQGALPINLVITTTQSRAASSAYNEFKTPD